MPKNKGRLGFEWKNNPAQGDYYYIKINQKQKKKKKTYLIIVL